MKSLVKSGYNNPRCGTALFFLLVFFPFSIFLSSCGSGCGGPIQYETTYHTCIRLADTSNRFEEILYADFSEHYYSSAGIPLSPINFFWNLRVSKPRTTMFIRTRNRGWDTLEYSMTKEKAVYSSGDQCDDADISMRIIGPGIVSHSFDSAYMTEIPYVPYFTSNVDRILYVK